MVVFDSAWVSPHPSVRSACALGDTVAEVCRSGYGQSPYRKAAFFVVDSLVAFEYLTRLHELGHARYVKDFGAGVTFETGATNWWHYQKRRPFSQAVTHMAFGRTRFDVPRFYAAGMNATTFFAERGRHQLAWDIQARLSSWVYLLHPQPSSLSDTAHLSDYWGNQNDRTMRTAQLAAYVASCVSPVDVFAYFNKDGISLKANVPCKDWVLSVESLTKSRNYDAEFGVSRVFTFARMGRANTVRAAASLSATRRGASVECSVSAHHLTLGARLPSQATLSGARYPRREVYLQYSTN